MVSLSKYGVKYWRTLFMECGGIVVLAIMTCGLDWALSFAPKLHFIAHIALSLFEMAESLAQSSYLETCFVVPWALGSYQVNRLLSTKAFITMQLSRRLWFRACSSTATLYIFLDGPAEKISAEWTLDILRATAHFITVALCVRGQKFCSALSVYGPPTLAAFVGLISVFLTSCFIFSKDPGAELIKLLYKLSVLEGHCLKMGMKHFHSLKYRLRDHFESLHREKLLKQGLPPFQYDSLDSGHIRLLRLKRRSLLSGVINTELVSLPFQQADFQFEALSYAWGDPEPQRPILVNGHRFDVGPNLHSMLHARSMMFRERLVWVDAICINQNDNDEKSVQITLMKGIYQKAKRTVAWLGDPFDAPLAVMTIRRIVGTWEMFDQSPQEVFTTHLWKTRRPEWQALSRLIRNQYFSRLWVFQEVMLGNDFQFYVGGHYLSFEYLNKALSAFNRGGENISNLLHGRILFEPGAGGLRWNDKGVPGTFTGIRSYWSVVILRRYHGTAFTLPLGYLLSMSAAILNAKNPRDKVYGLLGVADGPAASEMRAKVNYNKSPEEIFKEVAVLLLQRAKDLNQPAEDAALLLSHAGIGFGGRSKSLPSWVPDWNSESSMRRILNMLEPSRTEIEEKYKRTTERLKVKFGDPEKRNYSAGGKNYFVPVIDQQRWTLTVDAAQVDTLGQIGDHFSHDFDTSNLVSWFLRAETICESNKIHIPDGQDKKEALWRTLIADWADLEHPAPAEYADWFDIWKNLYVHKMEVKDLAEKLEMSGGYSGSGSETRHSVSLVAAISQLGSKYTTGLTAACRNRRFCVTHGGQLTLAPPESREGDVVCVIRGLQTPFIVRPVGQKTIEEINTNSASAEVPKERQSCLGGEYHLVGECYVHGIMDGEAMTTELQSLILV